MEVVVTTSVCHVCWIRRFTIESNLHLFAVVGREADSGVLAFSGNGVIDVFGAAVVPLAQDVPSIVGINQDDESVISL